jgi:hypothetical protein
MPADRSVLPSLMKENGLMVVLGIDAHKRTHTVVAVDANGRQLAVRTFGRPAPHRRSGSP